MQPVHSKEGQSPGDRVSLPDREEQLGDCDPRIDAGRADLTPVNACHVSIAAYLTTTKSELGITVETVIGSISFRVKERGASNRHRERYPENPKEAMQDTLNDVYNVAARLFGESAEVRSRNNANGVYIKPTVDDLRYFIKQALEEAYRVGRVSLAREILPGSFESGKR